MAADEDRIPAALLFQRIDAVKGGSAEFARALEISPQRLSNWRTRGIPASALPRVAAQLGITVEAYLAASGRPVSRAEQPRAAYLTNDEQQLLEHYRRATPNWQLTLRLLAKLPSEEHTTVSSSVNVLLAKIAADAVPDERLGAGWTRPDKPKR